MRRRTLCATFLFSLSTAVFAASGIGIALGKSFRSCEEYDEKENCVSWDNFSSSVIPISIVTIFVALMCCTIGCAVFETECEGSRFDEWLNEWLDSPVCASPIENQSSTQVRISSQEMRSIAVSTGFFKTSTPERGDSSDEEDNSSDEGDNVKLQISE